MNYAKDVKDIISVRLSVSVIEHLRELAHARSTPDKTCHYIDLIRDAISQAYPMKATKENRVILPQGETR